MNARMLPPLNYILSLCSLFVGDLHINESGVMKSPTTFI